MQFDTYPLYPQYAKGENDNPTEYIFVEEGVRIAGEITFVDKDDVPPVVKALEVKRAYFPHTDVYVRVSNQD